MDFELSPEEYVVRVDQSETLAQALEAGAYDHVVIDAERTLTGMFQKGAGYGAGPERRLRLAHFHVSYTNSNAGMCLLDAGLANAGLGELLAFGAAYPHIQTRYPVTAWCATTTTFGEPDYEVSVILTGTDRALAPGDRRWLLPDGPLAAGYRCVVPLYPWLQSWDDGRVVNGLQVIRFLVCVDETANDVLAQCTPR